MNTWWSWLLTMVGVTGIYLTTRRMWQGFLVGLAAQLLWVAYALATHQWGFIVSALAYGTVNAIGLRAWLAARAKPGDTP